MKFNFSEKILKQKYIPTWRGADYLYTEMKLSDRWK